MSRLSHADIRTWAIEVLGMGPGPATDYATSLHDDITQVEQWRDRHRQHDVLEGTDEFNRHHRRVTS